jgi:hypothetical protein
MLCPACGDSLVDQGYCGVCERFWNLARGEECPKHDIPLEEVPAEWPSDDEFTDWVSVAAYSQPMAAEAPRIRLEAEGIPTFLDGRHMGGHGLYQVATGGVPLQVPRHLADDARIVLSQTWSAGPIEGDDLDDAWDDLAPDPGSRRRTVMKAIIVAILALPLLRLVVSWLAG